MKCFREGCKNERMWGCTHGQCEYHHEKLCIEQDYRDTEHGYCKQVKRRK